MARGKPFQPGNTFGHGRPKGSGYIEVCRTFMEKAGWAKLEDLARTGGPRKDGKLALEAVKFLALYAYGRPREEANPSGNEPTNFRDAIMRAWKRSGLDDEVEATPSDGAGALSR